MTFQLFVYKTATKIKPLQLFIKCQITENTYFSSFISVNKSLSDHKMVFDVAQLKSKFMLIS